MTKCILSNTDDTVENIRDALKILALLVSDCETNKNAIFDMSELNWINPASSIILSSKLNELILTKLHTLTIIPPTNKNVKDYLERIGFPMGKNVMEGTCLPLRHFSENAEAETKELFKFVDATFPVTLKGNCVKYLLSELIDNVDQHSNYTHATIAAQHFPKKDFVGIGVVDNGVTIPGLYEKNGVTFRKDCDAILLAMNGMSTKADLARGYGLSSTKRITTEGLRGNYYLLSRKGLVHIDANGEQHIYILEDTEVYNGTLVYVAFSSPDSELDIYPYVQ